MGCSSGVNRSAADHIPGKSETASVGAEAVVALVEERRGTTRTLLPRWGPDNRFLRFEGEFSMARRLGAVSFARWAIDEFGKVVNDWATVRVSQAELARCYGVSASTVGWYLAELGDVVVRRRPLVFDLSRLVPAVQSREPAVEFAGLSEAFGRLAAGMNRLAAGSRGQAAVSSGFLEEEEAEDLSSYLVSGSSGGPPLSARFGVGWGLWSIPVMAGLLSWKRCWCCVMGRSRS